MRGFKVLLIAAASSALLTGCGSVTPDIIEDPPTVNALGGYVSNVALHVRCELRKAVYDAINLRGATFLNKWSAKITMTVSADEKTNITPSFGVTDVLNKIPETIGVGLAGNYNQRATRKLELTWYEIFSDLIKESELQKGCADPPRPRIEGNLKLEESLFAGVLPATQNGVFSNPFKDNGGPLDTIQNTITFDLDVGGSVTPTFKFVNVALNPSGTGLLTDRDRNDQLLITLGPATIDTSKRKPAKGARPSSEVDNAHQIGRFGLELQNFNQRNLVP